MKLVGIFILLVVVITLYVFARPRLLQIPAWKAVCDWIDPLATSWLSKSRQIAVARLTALSGFVVAFGSTVGDIPIDWQMIGDYIVSYFPVTTQPFIEKMLVPLAIWAYGEIMRRATTQPLAAKE